MSNNPPPPLPKELEGTFIMTGYTDRNGKVIPGLGVISFPKGLSAYMNVNKERLQKQLDDAEGDPKQQKRKTISVKVFQVNFKKYVAKDQAGSTFVPPGGA